MHSHGSDKNGLNWGHGSVEYDKLETVLSESVANLAHLYGFGASKCKFISDLFKRPVLNLEDFHCLKSDNFVPEHHCWLPCHKFPNVRCASKNAHSFYKWLTYHLQTKGYVKCPRENTRHNAEFLLAI
jgi:hypothetical protein